MKIMRNKRSGRAVEAQEHPLRRRLGVRPLHDPSEAGTRPRALFRFFQGLSKGASNNGDGDEYESKQLDILRLSILEADQFDECVSLPRLQIEDLNAAIDSLVLKKAPGYDGVETELLKVLPLQTRMSLLQAFHAHVDNMSYIPRQWQIVNLILLPKKVRPVDVGDFRSIALLSVVL